MNVVVFGTGLNALHTLQFLNEKYNILWFVDNNKEKIGNKIGNYEIKSPESLKNYNDYVIIIAENHTYEIMYQLGQIGIKKDKVMSLLCTYSGDDYSIDVYPINKAQYCDTGRKLLSYDLLNRIEQYKKRKILIFAKFYSVYTKQLVENLHKKYKDIEVSILTGAKETKNMINNESIAHIYYFESMQDINDILHKLPQYDVAQLLWIEEIWVYFTEEIRAKFKKLNICVGGSDFYRASKYDLLYKEKLIEYADNISAETPQTISDFALFYSLKSEKIKLLPFGLEVINYINLDKISNEEIRKKFKIPLDKIIVTCGHNAIQAHQHLKLIECLKGIKQEIKDRVVFVFPMTYPSNRVEYINQVRQKLEKFRLPYVIITDFMDFRLMAQYAQISDIMIHVQTTDQLSSTMLEEMYAGSIVITGDWLPYKILHDRNLFFLDANSIQDAVDKMEDVISNIKIYKQKCVANKEIIWKYHSWDSLVSKWYELME
jgi:glycosyltransferase involved in cell wall biosynthesis